MASTTNTRKDKNQNIQVFVRLRPINARERDLKSIGIVEVSGTKDVIVKQPLSDNKLTKKFSFDKAFGPNSKQVDVYQEVVSPLIEEVLAGYNCTVFAYGQTGTGKTHTMVGESSGDVDISWQNDPLSGIIPRSLSQLFDELRITNSEYTVRVSYLELYNEELFDLLSSSEDSSKLRIYEDVTRKGTNIVNGLEEMTVYSKNEVYNIMAKGQEKRRMASTLMNAQSSRSHTVFTIVVHMKENSPDGEELMKVGKLNLVDLAGSENISKAGSDNPARRERARECVNINQSLLTLGRVITALVERHPHIPYRESKLTRLLQESLGGRTKTSIIATISPGHKDIEETLSTLEYAHRARNILNKPEVNQKMTKRAVLKEFSEEIDRLKRDLAASREKNGVYLANETYAEMTLRLEEQEKDIQERILFIKAMNEEKERMEKVFNDMSIHLKNTENQLNITNQTLDQTKNILNDKKQELKQTRTEVAEQKHLVSKHVETETKLMQQAKSLLDIAENTTTDIDLLHNTVEKKRLLESNNLNTAKNFVDESQSHRNQIKEHLKTFTSNHIEQLSSLAENTEKHHHEFENSQLHSKKIIDDIIIQIQDAISTGNTNKTDNITSICKRTNDKFNTMKINAESECTIMNSKMTALLDLLKKLDSAREKERENVDTLKEYVKSWKDSSTAKILSLKHVQSEWWESVNSHLQNISEQNKINYENDLQDWQKLSYTNKQQEEDISKDLGNLKSMLSALESKYLSSKKNVYSFIDERCERSAKSQKSFSEMVQTVNESLSAKTQDINIIVSTFDETNKAFVKDMTGVLEDSIEKVTMAASIDKELKDNFNDISESNKIGWANYIKNADDAVKDINQFQTNIITDQCDSHNIFLNQCKNKQEEMLQPLQTTTENIHTQMIYHKQQINGLTNAMNSFNERMCGDLIVNDNIERAFLTEDYKSYSPTGKTPIRREFRYPRQLVNTSPHERILMRFRNTKVESPESDSIIELDNTIESTPFKINLENSQSSNTTRSSLDESDTIFLEPKPIKYSPNQNSMSKSISESDLYHVMNDKQSKENLDTSANEKKEFASRLKQPQSVKKILCNKN